MITGSRHAGIVVADLDRVLQFWIDVMGFVVTRRMEESGAYLETLIGVQGARATTVKLTGPDGSMIELLHFHSHPDRPGWAGTPYSTGLTHLAFTVEDLDAFCVHLGKRGATFSAPPVLSPDGAVKVTYATGPEGLLLELVEVLKR